MRCRLRTLLITFAAAPVLLSMIMVYYVGWNFSSQQAKDRETRRQMHAVRVEMAKWLNHAANYDPKNESVISAMKGNLAAKLAIVPGGTLSSVGYWNRKVRIGMAGEHVIFAKSDGPNGIAENGQGDDIQIRLRVQRPQRWLLSTENWIDQQ
jgi:hypothetical protein